MTSLEIEAFLTVQRTGSVTKAAELLYINQSSLSTRLRTLERELGCTLFVRGKGARAMQLTAEGERFLPLAQQHWELEKKMLTLRRGEPAQQELRVSALNSIGNYLLPAVYRQFSKHWPEIRLEIQDLTTAAAREAIARDQLDMAFSTISVSTEYITAIPFLTEPMTILCAADSDYPDPVPLEMLHPAREVYSTWCADVDRWHRETFGTDTEPQIHLELMSQIRLFVARPNAWAVVPDSIARSLEAAPDLRRCQPDFPIPDRRLFILCNRRTRDSQPVRHFLECLRTVLRQQGNPGLLPEAE